MTLLKNIFIVISLFLSSYAMGMEIESLKKNSTPEHVELWQEYRTLRNILENEGDYEESEFGTPLEIALHLYHEGIINKNIQELTIKALQQLLETNKSDIILKLSNRKRDEPQSPLKKH